MSRRSARQRHDPERRNSQVGESLGRDGGRRLGVGACSNPRRRRRRDGAFFRGCFPPPLPSECGRKGFLENRSHSDGTNDCHSLPLHLASLACPPLLLPPSSLRRACLEKVVVRPANSKTFAGRTTSKGASIIIRMMTPMHVIIHDIRSSGLGLLIRAWPVHSRRRYSLLSACQHPALPPSRPLLLCLPKHCTFPEGRVLLGKRG